MTNATYPPNRKPDYIGAFQVCYWLKEGIAGVKRANLLVDYNLLRVKNGILEMRIEGAINHFWSKVTDETILKAYNDYIDNAINDILLDEPYDENTK